MKKRTWFVIRGGIWLALGTGLISLRSLTAGTWTDLLLITLAVPTVLWGLLNLAMWFIEVLLEVHGGEP